MAYRIDLIKLQCFDASIYTYMHNLPLTMLLTYLFVFFIMMFVYCVYIVY